MNKTAKFTFLAMDHFFAMQPQHFRTFCEEPSDVVVWEALFEHFFQMASSDKEISSHPLEWRPGSSDPKWEILFIELKALKVQRLILKLKQRERLSYYEPLEEAA